MYVLDTDTLSQLHRGDPALQAYKDQFDPAQVVTTVITRIEMLQGRFDLLLKAADGEQIQRAFEWLIRTEDFLTRITILPITPRAAAAFDELRQHKKLKKIGRADLLIASIALAAGATLVTRDLKHFRQVPGLNVENWAD